MGLASSARNSCESYAQVASRAMLCREIVRKGQREKGHGLDAKDWTDMHRAHRGLVWSGLATFSAEVLPS